MNEKKYRMHNIPFVLLWTPVLILCLVLAVGGTLVMSFLQTAIVSYTDLPADSIVIRYAPGTENRETQYYTTELSAQQAMENGFAITEQLSNEGIVLLKNRNQTLPLSDTRVTLIGRRSVDPVFSGTGAGTVSSTGIIYPREAFEAAGFTVNSGAAAFFNDNYLKYFQQGKEGAVGDSDYWFVSEIPAADYTFTPAREEAAVVFIGRTAGENADMITDMKAYAESETGKAYQAQNAYIAKEAAGIAEGQHLLELTAEEKSMIAFAEANYDTVIVVFNAANVMELDELEADDGIDAILWMGYPGSTGFRSLARIMNGSINPSGHTADIFAADLTKDPSFVNFGNFVYSDEQNTFVNYAEGIYVGYKYYETAWAEAEKGNYPGFSYDEQVVYPFGYGLSYTSFAQQIESISNDGGDNYTVVVKVENTGSLAGKDVVQLYFTPPYHPEEGIEKAEVNLLAFAKTEIIPAGESAFVTLVFTASDLASYDYKNAGCYVLSAGEYELSVRADSHTVLDSRVITLEAAIYDADNPRPGDLIAAENRFDEVSAMFTDTPEPGLVLNMSRSDFAGTFPQAPGSDLQNVNRQIGSVLLSDALLPFDPEEHIDPEAKMPTLQAENGLSLIDLRGRPYDDPAWEKLLDQLTTKDMESLAWLGYGNDPMLSIGLPATNAQDGSAGWHKDTGCCAYSAACVTGCSWNPGLAYTFGTVLSEESLANDTLHYAGWYSPAVNTHRSAFCGRNYEYYSEDGVLSGWLAKSCIEGMMTNGVTTYIKHFALNEQETNRHGVCTWANEQAIREIYLKPFEIAVKKARASVSYYSDDSDQKKTALIPATIAMMTSYNSIGTTYSGGSYALLSEITRGEWGFCGAIISDGMTGNLSQALLAGEDGNLNLQAMAYLLGTGTLDTSEATYVRAAREAVHHYAYSIVNSNAMNGIIPGSTISYRPATWKIIAYGLVALFYLLFALGVFLVIRRCVNFSRQKKAQAVKEG